MKKIILSIIVIIMVFSIPVSFGCAEYGVFQKYNIDEFLNLSSGKNLFNKSTVTLNSFLTPSGTIKSSTVNAVSDFIKVKPNTSLVIQDRHNDDSSASFCWYDINKNFIDGQIYSTLYNTIFTLPENAYYIRFTVAMDMLNDCMVFFGSSIGADYEPYYDGMFTILTSNGYNMDMPYTFKTDLDYINQYDNESVLITLDSNLSNGVLEAFSYFAVAYPLESGNYLWLVFESIQRSFSHYGDDDGYSNYQHLSFHIYSYIFTAEDFGTVDFNFAMNTFNPKPDENVILILNSLDGIYPPIYSVPYDSSEPIQFMINPSTNDLINPSFNFNVMHNKKHFIYDFEIPLDFLDGDKIKPDSDVYYLLSVLTDYDDLTEIERTIQPSVIDSLDYIDVNYNNVLTNYFDNNFQDGYEVGYEDGYEKGYQDAYDTDSYQDGFKQSVIDAFPAGLGAFASIIMAFFNIEIFGFKPLHILIGISGLSLALIIYRVLRGN